MDAEMELTINELTICIHGNQCHYAGLTNTKLFTHSQTFTGCGEDCRNIVMFKNCLSDRFYNSIGSKERFDLNLLPAKTAFCFEY